MARGASPERLRRASQARMPGVQFFGNSLNDTLASYVTLAVDSRATGRVQRRTTLKNVKIYAKFHAPRVNHDISPLVSSAEPTPMGGEQRKKPSICCYKKQQQKARGAPCCVRF